MEPKDLKNLVGIFDISQTTEFRSIENFIPVYDYFKYGIEPTSSWEYGSLKFGDIYLRIFASSLHSKFVKDLEYFFSHKIGCHCQGTRSNMYEKQVL